MTEEERNTVRAALNQASAALEGVPRGLLLHREENRLWVAGQLIRRTLADIQAQAHGNEQ